MQNSKIKALYDYLLQQGFTSKAELNKIADQKTTLVKKWHGHNGVNKGILIGWQSYSGFLSINGYKEKNFNEQEVVTLINIWLLENDPFYNPQYNQDVHATGVNVTSLPLEIGTYLLEIEILFNEMLVLIEDEDGKFTMDGKTYRLANQTLPAENFETDYLMNNV